MDAIFGSFSVRLEIFFTSQKLKYEYLKYELNEKLEKLWLLFFSEFQIIKDARRKPILKYEGSNRKISKKKIENIILYLGATSPGDGS